MKLRYMILFFIGAFFLQSTVLNEIPLFSITPNLILCLVVLFTFWYGGYQPMGLGIAFGLLQDLCFGELIGIAPICYLVVSLGILLTQQLLYRDNILSVFFLTLVSTVVYELCYWLLHAAMGGTAHILYALSILPISIIYNCIITILIAFLFGRKMTKYPQDRYM